MVTQRSCQSEGKNRETEAGRHFPYRAGIQSSDRHAAGAQPVHEPRQWFVARDFIPAYQNGKDPVVIQPAERERQSDKRSPVCPISVVYD